MNSLQSSIEEITNKIYEFRESGQSIFVSSSFQSHSIPLLHILSRIDRAIPIVFVNTGFLFSETISYRDQIVAQLGLNLVEVKSTVPKIQQLNSLGNFFFTSDPDRCCHINKVEPLEPLLIRHDIWIAGIRHEQNSHRSTMRIEEEAPHGCKRYHPLLHWTSQMISDYRSEHQLPPHPLEKDGYRSIGCEPCTRRFASGENRSGRWAGLNKTECGLHIELAEGRSQK